MNKKMVIGLVLLVVSTVSGAVALQLSEIARYLCILSGEGFTHRCLDFLNPIAGICLLAGLVVSVILIIAGFSEQRREK